MDNPNFQNILSQLKANKHGNQWLAQCPTHDDRQASLSVSQAAEGTILIKCFAGCTTETIVDHLGLKMADLFLPKEKSAKREIVATYDYCDEQGRLLFQAVRFEPKHFSQRRRDDVGNWIWGLSAGEYAQSPKGDWYMAGKKTPPGWPRKQFPEESRRSIYCLSELLTDESEGWVFIPEGEKDCDSLRKLGLTATTNPQGAGKWRSEFNRFFTNRKVCILPDVDPPSYKDPQTGKIKLGFQGQKHALEIYEQLKPVAEHVTILELPVGYPTTNSNSKQKSDVSDWLKTGGTRDALLRFADSNAANPAAFNVWLDELRKRIEEAETTDEKKPAKNSRTSFVDLVLEKAKLFHNADNQPFASITINGHVETYPMESRLFRLWLSGFHFKEKSAALSSDAEKEMLRTLQAEALYNGEEREVTLRLAQHEDKLYFDLADRDWRVVEISADGWKILPSAEAPVRFVRRLAMLPLPEPVTGGKLDEMRGFMNVEDDATWALVASWLVMTLHPSGPYPILSVTGEQGSAKTSFCKLLRSTVDPNRADLRAVPKDERDLMIAATNSHLMAYDNLSGITQELSDSLCRIATGAGFATRTLHSNDEETIFSVRRPILTNGIIDATGFPDLLDRTVSIFLRAIPDHKRREEHELWQGFNQAKPRILGALLSGVSHALKHRETVQLTHRPRMADFARWAVAAEEGIGLAKGAFFEAYESNRSSSNELALDNPIAVELQAFMALSEDSVWIGTATDLFKALNLMISNRGEIAKDKYGWPKSANSLSGKLRRLAPNLRRVGIEVECGRTNGGSKLRIERVPKRDSVQLEGKDRHIVTFENNTQ